MLLPPTFKSDEIQIHITDTNTKFSAKSTWTLGLISEMFIYMENLQFYAHILFNVIKMFRVYSFV